MKRTTKTIMMIATVILMASCAQRTENAAVISDKDESVAETTGSDSYTISPTESELAWKGTKIGGEHWGTIGIKQGTVFMKNGTIVGGDFIIDMKAIKVLDITDAETAGKLKGHLESDDFFSAEKHPEAFFKITSAEMVANAPAGQPNYKIKGNLNIKAITKSIEFMASVETMDKTLKTKADFDLDRTQWDIRYASGKFFPSIGDKMINDNFNIKLNIVAKQG